MKEGTKEIKKERNTVVRNLYIADSHYFCFTYFVFIISFPIYIWKIKYLLLRTSDHVIHFANYFIQPLILYTHTYRNKCMIRTSPKVNNHFFCMIDFKVILFSSLCICFQHLKLWWKCKRKIKLTSWALKIIRRCESYFLNIYTHKVIQCRPKMDTEIEKPNNWDFHN